MILDSFNIFQKICYFKAVKYLQVRNSSKSIKKIKGKNGKPDKIELIINSFKIVKKIIQE